MDRKDRRVQRPYPSATTIYQQQPSPICHSKRGEESAVSLSLTAEAEGENCRFLASLGMTNRRGLLKGRGPLPREKAIAGRRGRLSHHNTERSALEGPTTNRRISRLPGLYELFINQLADGMQQKLMSFLDACRCLAPNQQLDIGHPCALAAIAPQKRNCL